MQAGTGQGLHSRDPIKLLKAQFKKNPEVEDIYNNIHSTSDDAIDALDCRPWIKKKLKNLRAEAALGLRREEAAQEMAEKLAAIMRYQS